MIVIPLQEWFRLPRLGKDGFKRIVSAGVEYESKSGFRVRNNADLLNLKLVIASELNDDVQFTFRCFSCGERASCSDCVYNSGCGIEFCGRCVCSKCMKLGYANYVMAWRRLLASNG